jgi:hypothetical protein
MLGNDVVDLQDADADPGSFRPRFDERVFSEAERAAIADDPYPLARRWAHWAAKEAAYKLARQIDEHFVFSPSILVARFEPVPDVGGQRLGRIVRHGRLDLPRTLGTSIRVLELRSFETSEWVHAVVIPSGSDWEAVQIGFDSRGGLSMDSSGAVRSLALRGIARSLAVQPERLALEKRGRIPVVELDGARTSLALSLSHHGRWVGFACAPWGTVTSGRVEAARKPWRLETMAAAMSDADSTESKPGAIHDEKSWTGRAERTA